MEFDPQQWFPVIGILLGPSIAVLAIQLILSSFAPEWGERAKANIPTIFLGAILLSLAGALVAAFTDAIGGGGEGETFAPIIPLVLAFIV